MIPYHDENETLRTPVVTIGLIVVTTATWVLAQGAGSSLPLAKSVCNFGLIPGELTLSLPPGTAFPMGRGVACLTDPGRQSFTLLTSMFLHGSWMHLIGNMWFLWLFGNNIEDSMTRPRFLAFYLLSGLAAAATQVAANPMSEVPMVGASGAISGVMGAYLVLFPRVRVYTIIPLGFFIQSFALPAWVMLIYWMLLQFFGGVTSVVAERGGGGVAFWAHIGGFIAGLALIKIFERRERVAARSAGEWRPNDWERW
jgi:membrane associated rhomboid family serine protease